MHYTIYKTTNLITGKVYVGFHKTDNLDDGYLGSGKLFQRALKKYGPENFHKEILFDFDNPEDMFAKEAELVSEDFVADPNTYNIKQGGFGGFDYLNTTGLNRHGKYKDPEYRQKMSRSVSKAFQSDDARSGLSARQKKAWSDGKFNNVDFGSRFAGKTHTPEARSAISKAVSKHQSGEGNSQYGTCWIHSNEEKRSMKINRNDLQGWIDRGWIKGRKLKFDHP